MTTDERDAADRPREERVRRLRIVAGVAALVVAGIHLLHPTQGGAALAVYVNVGYLGDPRPLLFTLGGFALVFGVLLGYFGLAGRPVYVAGIVVTLAFLLGYPAWHTVLDHGGFWPYIEAHGHGGNPVVVVAEHLAADSIALASTIAELVLLVSLLVLYRLDA